jgi:2,4-dienoyl-CoA reductase-like NADH-dependent reductase (Old Yellow Enzyme family)
VYLRFVEARGDMLCEYVNIVDTLEPYRQIWKGPSISTGSIPTSMEHAVDVAEKTGNLIAFGRIFIANPDLPERLHNVWDLKLYYRPTFYIPGEVEGYADYPFYDTKNQL